MKFYFLDKISQHKNSLPDRQLQALVENVFVFSVPVQLAH